MSTSGVGFICLYDHEWNALGNWTQHVAKSWNLKRKAQESDEFNAICKDFENSKDACFVALHEPTGGLKYACFCGIPKTNENGFTTITGIDCRTLFNQEMMVNYTSLPSSYEVTVADLFQYLMWDVFVENGWLTINSGTGAVTNNNFGVDFAIDLTDLSLLGNVWNESYINRTDEIRNVWEELLKACACYDLYIKADISVDSNTNKYKLTFSVRRIYNTRSIKLSDYNVKMKLNQNITNRVIVRHGSGNVYYETLYLYNDNTIGYMITNKMLFPPVTQTIYKESLSEAVADAYKILQENRFKDRVVIDLSSKLGSTLEDMDFSFYGDLVGYNPADSSSIKRLPVSAVSTDSNGKKVLEFGRLSEYWFLD